MFYKKLNRFDGDNNTNTNDANEVTIFNNSIYYIVNRDIGMNNKIYDKAKNMYNCCRFK